MKDKDEIKPKTKKKAKCKHDWRFIERVSYTGNGMFYCTKCLKIVHKSLYGD